MLRLLIIEDDPNTLSGLQELLSYEGYIVFGASNGTEALEIVTSEAIEIVLCDYSLPDFNGIQVCDEIKKLHPAIPLILITAYRNSEIVREAVEHGIERVLGKPIILDELFNTLLIATTRVHWKQRLSQVGKTQ